MENYILDSHLLGNTFDNVAAKAKSIAKEKGVIVEFDFNGIKCLVSKDTDLQLLWRDYSNAHLMEWKEVGYDCAKIYSKQIEAELKKRIKESEEKQRLASIEYQKKDDLQRKQFEEKTSHVKMEFKALSDWELGRSKNTDPYGNCVYEYAEGWAKLMQVEMLAGNKLEDIAEKTSHGMGFLGITGFMYGAAVSVLSHCWLYGERLRKWHNKEYNHEGEGVVNPAILTISV